MTKARDTGEVLNTRGTAATADVQTSPTDATAGALMAVGAFGLGTDSIGYIGAGQDADTYDVSGVYYAGFSNGYTTGSAFLTVEASAGTRVKQIWRQANGTGIAERYKDATWSEWKRTDPQAFGLGGYVISADTDYDSGDYLVGGNYITPSSAMSNAPSDYTSGRHVIAVDGTAIYIAQTLYGVSSSDKGKIWSRAFDGVTWSDWEPVYTGANFQPEVRAGLNTKDVYFMVSGTVAVDATVSGSLLYFAKLNASGQYVPSTNSPSGTVFKNLSVQSCTTTVPCTFTRTS